MNKLPKSRSENIVVQNLKDEILIYDLTIDKAYCLNETSGLIYQNCDGAMPFDKLKAEHGLTDDVIFLALDGLRKNNLLEDDSAYVSPFAGMSRREIVKKVGLATMIALPVISTLVAPQASQAASGQNQIPACQPCSQPNECTSGRCAQIVNTSDRICNAGLNSALTNRPGFSFEIGNSLICTTYGEQFCCSGDGASFNQAANRCTCLPFI